MGIKTGSRVPAMQKGDLLLARLLKNGKTEYGVKGIWYITHLENVTQKTFVPWTDSTYSTIMHFEPLIMEFSGIFSENFKGWESTKVKGLAQIRLNASIVSLKSKEIIDYLENIVFELKNELNVSSFYNGKNINVLSYIQNMIMTLKEGSRSRKTRINTQKTQPVSITKSVWANIVGPRIDSPILNYAPVNELGVVVLFGFYMHELGFSHLEEIRSTFPDAIGMNILPNGRLQRVGIEFEYESVNFKKHNHDPGRCDIIVCWIHNWPNCPPNLTVIELKSFIEQMTS